MDRTILNFVDGAIRVARRYLYQDTLVYRLRGSSHSILLHSVIRESTHPVMIMFRMFCNAALQNDDVDLRREMLLRKQAEGLPRVCDASNAPFQPSSPHIPIHRGILAC